MDVTGPVKVLLATIFVFVTYVTWGAYVEGREARQLAGLGPCGLAQAYVEWRFEGGDRALDAVCTDRDAFEHRRAEFAHAARLVDVGSVASDRSALVDRLRALTSPHDDPAQAAGASTDAFADAFGAACPSEFAAVAARFVD